MNKSTFATGRCIRLMRCARPAIDFGLLVLALLLFLYFDEISVRGEIEENRPNRIERALSPPLSTPSTHRENQQKPVSIDQQFSTETDMWNTFSSWLQVAETTSGHCRFETRPELNQTPYALRCMGSSNTTNNRPGKTVGPGTLFESNILVTPEKVARPTNQRNETHDQPVAAENNPVRVSGWINTPSGRRYFDPASKKWLP